MPFKFVFEGEVVGKPRPRFSSRGSYARAYTPKKCVKYERALANAFKTQGGKKICGAVKVRIDTYRALPKSRPKRIQSERDIYKPDVDNISKAVLDALNGLAYEDDKQVVDLRCIKHDRKRRKEYLVVTIERYVDEVDE